MSRILRTQDPFDIILRNESQDLPVTSANSITGNHNPLASVTIGADWRASAKPTIVANTWTRPIVPIFQVDIGRKYLIKRITVETTDDCELIIVKSSTKYTTPNGSSATITLDRMIKNMTGSITAVTGGVYTWSFDMGDMIVLKSGERIDLYYARNSTTGTNWKYSVEGYSLTNDDNYSAPFKVGIIGDSIAYGTAAMGSIEYVKREDGTVNGLWPMIIRNNLFDAKIDCRVVNLGQGGSDSGVWDFLVNNGRLNALRDAELLFVTLGINDAAADTNISVTGGVDGLFKKYIKNIVRAYFRLNPNGSCIVNQITATDRSDRTGNVASGIYAGVSRIVAYRTDLAAAVTEMKAANPSWDLFLSGTDAAYTSANTTYFLETETAGTYLHPNAVLGQPAMAAIQWTTVQLTKFYLNNHS